MAKQYVWLGRDWTVLVSLGVFLVTIPALGGAVAGVSYLVGWGVEGTRLDPFVEEVQNTNGSYSRVVPSDEVGGPHDRIMSGLVLLIVAALVFAVGYAVRPRKVEGRP